jgi:hypothetical protein
VPSASDRRAAVLRAVGVEPLFCWTPAETHRGRSGRARVYIDVSGSMVDYVPLRLLVTLWSETGRVGSCGELGRA